MLTKFTHPRPGYYDQEGRFVSVNTPKVVTSKTHVATASDGLGNPFGLGGGGSGGGATGGGTGSISGGLSGTGGGVENVSNRYNPVRDRLDEGSVVEDWIPRDASGLDYMFRLMYHRDHIAGTVVDLLADSIWSDYTLVGIKDPAIMRIYEESLSALDINSVMPDLTREYLVLGRSISSLIYDSNAGIFCDLISHDPDMVRLTPIPIRGFDPKVDLIPSPALRAFIDSQDPRDEYARKALPSSYLDAVRSAVGGFSARSAPVGNSYAGGTGAAIPLDPINTLFTARRVFNYDTIGTSFYTRLITFWALEKALINASVTSARRRIRSILHAKVGIDGVWDPTPAEMDAIAQSIMQTEEDPVGGVVVTRTGVDMNELRDGASFYKWSDEWTMLTEGKLRALGANDALLSGDATYSNQEAARSFFMDRANMLRQTLTQKVFMRKIFPLLAQVHGFTKRSQAELDHNIRVSNKTVSSKYMVTAQSQENYLIPTINWHKDLVSQIDDQKIERLKSLEELGFPITLKQYSAAANIDLDDLLQDTENDALIRKKIAEWKESAIPEDAEDLAKQDFVKSLRNLSESNLRQVVSSTDKLGPLRSYLFWNEKGNLGPLAAEELIPVIAHFDPSTNAVYATVADGAFKKTLREMLGHPIKAELAHYLLHSTGFTPIRPVLSKDAIEVVSEQIKSCLDRHSLHGNVYQLSQIAQKELKALAEYSEQYISERIAKWNSSAPKIAKRDRIPNNSKQLFSGV